jgi:hypothetical protein
MFLKVQKILRWSSSLSLSLSQFKRYLDGSKIPLKDNKKTPACYYFNTIYGTSSWYKPYCLRGNELKPSITRDRAATLIQG